jgi:integrase
MQVKLTAGFVIAAGPPSDGKDRVIYWDDKRPGFGLMVTAAGKRSFVFQYRNDKGESRRASLSGTTKLPDAHKWADIIQGDVAKGTDPVEKKKAERAAQSKKGKFRTIAQDYVKRERSKVRSMDQREAILDRLVYPVIGDKVAVKLKRSDIVALLDDIEDEHGAGMADSTLMVVRRICNWHAARDDEFRSPIVRGMGRSTSTGRERILSDEEIRTLWAVTGEIIENQERERLGLFMYAHLLRYLLLTAVRLNEGARMVSAERNGGDWLIPSARMKNKRDFLVPLSGAALALLEAIPAIGGHNGGPLVERGDSGPIFTTNGRTPVSGFHQFKLAFDKRCSVTGWTNHDLRRTARSLMSRAGVNPDHAERALSHTIGGIRGTYDRHEFYNEKKRAFEALAAQIEMVLNPPANNVIPMRNLEISA